MNIRRHHVEIVHPCRTVLLTQKYVAESRWEHGAELIVRLQIHSQLSPHLMILVCHNLVPLHVSQNFLK
ncbi:hypothetical protein SDC9_143237 [bioreactor metagenome]|uniref:Uncharacterized protein n=1 Tax=bioreactor metagenome TaxID=1076179 RepID=A0A645E2S7_9ZZZZ